MRVPEIGTSVFLIPSAIVKNSEDRLVVLNRTAQAVIDELRGQNSEYVFVFRNKPTTRILNSAWKKARIRADLTTVRVHDLKHTFGRRLRASGVSFEDRQDLLGHKSGRITTHYSAAEIENLIKAANTVCKTTLGSSSPTLTLLRRSGTNFVPISLVQSNTKNNLDNAVNDTKTIVAHAKVTQHSFCSLTESPQTRTGTGADSRT